MDEIIGETLRKLWPLAPWTSSNISWPLSTLSLITGSLLSLVPSNSPWALRHVPSSLSWLPATLNHYWRFAVFSRLISASSLPYRRLSVLSFLFAPRPFPQFHFLTMSYLYFFASGYSSSKIYVLLYSIELNFPAVVRLLFFQGMGVPCDFYDCWNSVLLQWVTCV